MCLCQRAALGKNRHGKEHLGEVHAGPPAAWDLLFEKEEVMPLPVPICLAAEPGDSCACSKVWDTCRRLKNGSSAGVSFLLWDYCPSNRAIPDGSLQHESVFPRIEGCSCQGLDRLGGSGVLSEPRDAELETSGARSCGWRRPLFSQFHCTNPRLRFRELREIEWRHDRERTVILQSCLCLSGQMRAGAVSPVCRPRAVALTSPVSSSANTHPHGSLYYKVPYPF
ncbi:uncharacterized protein [Struthio camelus]|uniref:uncharacterized protein n=1 Tax=Struthio camelus TaxID=8801 RepID=UPI0036040344